VRKWLALAVVCCALGDGARAIAAPLPVPGTGVLVKDSQPDYAWNAGYQSRPVTFPSRRSHATLAGTLYGPASLTGRLPAVVAIPPSGGAATQGSVSYIAKLLAINGYIGLTVDPQGVGASGSLGDPPCGTPAGRSDPSPCANVPFQQMDNFFDAGQSALDFLLSKSDPWLHHVDPSLVGATGHSEGARAASYLQDPHFDGRVKVVVALDNLASNYCGDAGTPSNEGPGGSTGVQNAVINGMPDCLTDRSNPDYIVRPVGPAMGLASDGPGGFGQNDPTGTLQGSREEKKTAMDVWRSNGVPSMELVLRGVNHNQFAQTSTSNETLLRDIAFYAKAWFDLFLKNERAALATLRSRTTPTGAAITDFLSSAYLSAMYVPRAHVDCADFRASC
jgi:hypothetical protein